jgi:putative ABC transport system permease protein
MYVDVSMLPYLSQRFKALPAIESVAMKSYTLTSFMDKVANLVLITAGILTLFGVIIAVGVVYNSARVGLQERAWELASLRVLGFSRAEVARILFGEFALEVGLGVPLGLAISQAIISLIAYFHSNESFQIPGVIGARTYALAALIVMVAALASAYVVRRRIDRLDLVSVLKTRD